MFSFLKYVVNMELTELKEKIKKIALDSGAKLVGFGSQERLKNAPPSGDMNYCLPSSQCCIIFAYPNSLTALENYFSKKERLSLKKELHFAYSNAWKTSQTIAEFIENNTEFKTFPVVPNFKYREGFPNIFKVDVAYPDFSLRYGAVAAGLGHLGWSGNLVTKEYGGSLFLGGVLTTAPIEPDPMAKENNCNGCKLCIKSCTSGYASIDEKETAQPVIIGDQIEIYSKRGAYSKCGISCLGLTGLSEDSKWTIWSPNHVSLKKISNEEWKDVDIRRKLMYDLVSNKETPEKIRNFNKKLIKSSSLLARKKNVALVPAEKHFGPRCGNCAFICVADPLERAKLFKMLKNSGKMYIDDEGKEFTKKIT